MARPDVLGSHGQPGRQTTTNWLHFIASPGSRQGYRLQQTKANCGSGATANTVYTVDVKTIIEDIIGRTGWASGNAITLLLSGVAEDVGSGCQSDQAVTTLQVTYFYALLGTSTDAVLTVNY